MSDISILTINSVKKIFLILIFKYHFFVHLLFSIMSTIFLLLLQKNQFYKNLIKKNNSPNLVFVPLKTRSIFWN